MNTTPLHPAVVHLPLALAMLMPAFAVVFGWAIWRHRVRPRAWLGFVALQVLLVGSGVVATNTGEAEEDRVEAIVQKSVIHEHEELAEQFVWAAAATLVLAGLVLVIPRPAVIRSLIALVAVATIVVAGLALRVGHAGGRLVYEHGAASAYTGARSPDPGR
jgi:uncharacterized membrane protein